MKNLPFIASLFCLFFSTGSLFAQSECIATTGFWSDNEVDHPFLCDEPALAATLIIPADVTVSIDEKIDLPNEVLIVVNGVLFFDGNASRLTLTGNSGISIALGGAIQTNVNNNSQKVRIGDKTFWTSKDGTVAGPVNYGNVNLPIELVSFSLKKNSTKVDLSWSTSSETNSDFFAIEHSRNARDFSVIGQVKAAGNATTNTDYEFSHEQPASGTNYYRLREQDLDGSIFLSDIRSIDFQQEDFFTLSQSVDFANLRIQFREPLNSLANIRIFDYAGKLMEQEQVGMEELVYQVAIGHLFQGHYVLQIENQGRKYAKPFVKIG